MVGAGGDLPAINILMGCDEALKGTTVTAASVDAAAFVAFQDEANLAEIMIEENSSPNGMLRYRY